MSDLVPRWADLLDMDTPVKITARRPAASAVYLAEPSSDFLDDVRGGRWMGAQAGKCKD